VAQAVLSDNFVVADYVPCYHLSVCSISQEVPAGLQWQLAFW